MKTLREYIELIENAEQVTEYAGLPRDGGDERPQISRIVQVVDSLLKTGNTVDSYVLGARGHVERADLQTDGFTPNGALQLRKLGTKPSKQGARGMRPFLAKDDDNYEILMVGPKHYKIVDKLENRTDGLAEDAAEDVARLAKEMRK